MKRSPQLLFDPGAGTGSGSKIVGRTFGVARFSGMIPGFFGWPTIQTYLGLAAEG